MTIPVYLLKGADDVLRGEALTKLLDELVGDGDRSLLVDEFDLDTTTLGAAVDAAQTIPFLTDRRIVVVRRFGRFSKNEQVAGLVDYLADPLTSSVVVLVWEKSVVRAEGGDEVSAKPAVPAALTKAVKAAGGEILTFDPPDARNRLGWVADQIAEAGLQVDNRGCKLIADRLGEEGGAIIELIERLRGAYPPGTRLGEDDVEPYLSRSGGVPPWDLTDAIDKGDGPLALSYLDRMLRGGDRHPLAIMANLQGHYLRMLRLDGAGARGEKDAAAVLGLKGSTFPAKKALDQGRKLGGTGVRRAVELLAEADVDLRGASAWPGELVMEVLVARLARLSRAAR